MSEALTVTAGNIDKVIASLKKEIRKVNENAPDDAPLWIAFPAEINYDKYKGKGRPRHSDYYSMSEMLGEFVKTNGFELADKAIGTGKVGAYEEETNS